MVNNEEKNIKKGSLDNLMKILKLVKIMFNKKEKISLPNNKIR